MHDERAAAEQRDAAVREAVQAFADARRTNPPQVVAPLPKVWKPRNVRIGHAEFELDKLAFFILLILVAVCGAMALAYSGPNLSELMRTEHLLC